MHFMCQHFGSGIVSRQLAAIYKYIIQHGLSHIWIGVSLSVISVVRLSDTNMNKPLRSIHNANIVIVLASDSPVLVSVTRWSGVSA